MPITTSDISSISNTLKTDISTNSIVGDISSVTSVLKDPIGGTIVKTISSINSLSAVIDKKISNLIEDITKSDNNNGRIKLSGSELIVTVKPAEQGLAEQTSKKLQSDISSINSSISKLNTLTSTLGVLNSTVSTLKKAMDIQELLLSVNPISKATMIVFKQALKILFFKDALGEYSNILNNAFTQNKLIINSLSNKFHNLQVKVTISDESQKGNVIDQEQAAVMISEQNLNNETSYSEEYTTISGESYILKIEKYGDKQLIARAYDYFSDQIKQQTAPSFIYTSDQLIDEIKHILELQ